MKLTNTRVLITGANGFIGGRLAERLTHEENTTVRGLVRNGTSFDFARDKLLTHHDFEIATGDVCDEAVVHNAVAGCAIVVHCAAMQGGRAKIDDYRRVNVGGTLNLLRAARAANVQRFVHISTINVHGFPPPRDANADSPLDFGDGFYSVTKAEGERAVSDLASNYHFPITIVRPGCTYGPRSVAWTLTPLARVKRGAPVLIGDGSGICNAVYIDNLIDLILLALKNDAAIGQSFIGTEGRGVTWREFYGAYARMAGVSKINSMPRWFALLAATGFGALARWEGYPPRVDRASVEFYSHRVVYDIEKSKRLLGYAPKISFEEGMRRTEEWLRNEQMLK
ncbi:MAG: NAD-dependent epimerase/dehydratase family protein [Chloroflexi bacterium]|nr:NAD-dependent epimerase/dehydratase family protein [Chloroflexota bacterium]